MKKITANTNQILVWEKREVDSKLEKSLLQTNQTALVFEVPEKYLVAEKYVMFDGQDLYEVAKKYDLPISLDVLEKSEDFKLHSDYNDEYWPNLPDTEFKELIERQINDSIVYQKNKKDNLKFKKY